MKKLQPAVNSDQKISIETEEYRLLMQQDVVSLFQGLSTNEDLVPDLRDIFSGQAHFLDQLLKFRSKRSA